uniref:Uncharacterized protein n=1 Tax=Oncorhynchus kisutch TaxID=8019 RepID=A0A8C7IQ52_ONCKI
VKLIPSNYFYGGFAANPNVYVLSRTGNYVEIGVATVFGRLLLTDYSVQQALVHLGALHYSDTLTEILRNGELLSSDDSRNVGICVCAIWCVGGSRCTCGVWLKRVLMSPFTKHRFMSYFS